MSDDVTQARADIATMQTNLAALEATNAKLVADFAAIQAFIATLSPGATLSPADFATLHQLAGMSTDQAAATAAAEAQMETLVPPPATPEPPPATP